MYIYNVNLYFILVCICVKYTSSTAWVNAVVKNKYNAVLIMK